MTDTVARTNRERMGRTELLEEVEWLLDAGVHPLLIADVMHRTAESIDVAARRLGNARVAAAFREGVWEERQRRRRIRSRTGRIRPAAIFGSDS